MTQQVSDVPATLSPSEFYGRLEGLLAHSYTECFSEETKGVRNSVYVIGFVLILFSVGILSPEGKPIEVPLVKLNFIINHGLRSVLAILCGFFDILLCFRSYAEWQDWLLRNTPAMLELREMSSRIFSALARHSARMGELLKKSTELWERIIELPLGSDERQRLTTEHQKVSQDFDEEYRKIELADFPEKQEAIRKELLTVGRITRIRIWLEAVFPIVFGAAAIFVATVAR